MKIFVSRNLAPSSLLVTTAQAENWTLNAFSLIEHTSLPAKLPSTPFDFIFFSSPTAVQLFCSHFTLPSVPVCTLGPGTSSRLPEGVQVAFEGIGKTSEVAIQYASFAKGKSTLFPIGNQSIQTIQQGLAEQEVLNFVCYETKAKAANVNAHDIYIFSSPSNVKSFFLNNEISTNAKVIALGNKTKEALKEAKIESKISKDYTQQGILDTIFSIVHS